MWAEFFGFLPENSNGKKCEALVSQWEYVRPTVQVEVKYFPPVTVLYNITGVEFLQQAY